MKTNLNRLVKGAVLSLVVAFLLSIFTTEYQGKWALRSHAKPGQPLSVFKKKYREPRYTYSGWASLPQAYQQLFGSQVGPEGVYYAYQMEALPSYWSFVVSVDSETQTIQRFIYWKAIALKPRENY